MSKKGLWLVWWRYLALGLVVASAVFYTWQHTVTSAALVELAPTATACAPDACPTPTAALTAVPVTATPDLTPSFPTSTPGPPTPTPGPPGAMALDCDAAVTGVQTNCTYDVGMTFHVQVHAVEAPMVGYAAFQAKVRWDDLLVGYLPTDDRADEALWPECDIPARSDNTAGLPDRILEPSVLFGCVPFPVPSEGSVFVGAVLEFAFECSEQGNALLELVPEAGDPQQGSHYVTRGGQSLETTVADATVLCVESAVAGAEVRVLPQSGTRLESAEAGLWTRLTIALAALGALAAGVGALRLRGRGRS